MKLTLVKQGSFLGTKCDFYVDEKNNIYMSRTQIGYALKYKDPSNAIRNIHARHYKRLDGFSIEVTTAQIERVSKHQSEDKLTFMYSAQGIFEICRHSNQPNADEFYDWVYQIVLEIAKNGYYIAAAKDEKWLGIRQEAKQARNQETDMIKKFVEYAKEQGSNNADRYYIHLTSLANRRCGIEAGGRDKADQKTLLRLKSLETLIEMRLETLVGNEIPYKKAYEDVKELIESI